jgi:hypothetical protein
MGEATRDDVPGGLLEEPPLIDESHSYFFERLSNEPQAFLASHIWLKRYCWDL